MSNPASEAAIPQLVVCATAFTDSQADTIRAMETLSRAVTGLALDGIFVSVTVGAAPPDDTDDEP